MKACVLALTLAWAPAAWALPIPDPSQAACTSQGGSWWAFDVGGTCLMPRGTITPRETIVPREVITPRLEPVLPAGGALVGVQAPPPLSPTPEPGTLMLVGTTLAGVGVWWRLRRGR